MNTDESWAAGLEAMIQVLRRHGIRDERVLAAMAGVRRHLFIPSRHRYQSTAYADHPAEIGFGQTISQPYIVAYMIECLALREGEKVLEIGAGSGYVAAVLTAMGMDVYSVERIPELARHAAAVLAAEGFERAHILCADGYRGWAEHAPYDAVILSCAPVDVPAALVAQLRDGGRMVLPVGIGVQHLMRVRKVGDRVEQRSDIGVRFVPMVESGGAGQ